MADAVDPPRDGGGADTRGVTAAKALPGRSPNGVMPGETEPWLDTELDRLRLRSSADPSSGAGDPADGWTGGTAGRPESPGSPANPALSPAAAPTPRPA